ncbi:hypothetical protein [Sphingopyxis sp. NFH-91]|uniref:hypothetical protein n=1 Tax=Sphingopyxis sp. NFH-91 TaxID=2744457 RepID=UPI001F193620|nr:hypothetical protein [Sphingopyxis sp. NFH-91]
MANNLHISYDLYQPGQNYDGVIAKIKELGSWAKVHKSFWYVNSPYTARQAVNHIWPAMDARDTIYVVDATNNNSAWENLPDNVASHIRDQWNK